MVSDTALIVGHQQAARAVRDRVERYAKLAWAGMAAHRDADVDRLVEMLVPQVLAGQRQIANLTDAYIATLAGTAPVGVDPELVTGSAVRIGAEPEEVYRRPAGTVYGALAEGKAYDLAVAQGGRRLMSLVGTDLQLAMRAQEQQSFSGTGFDFYGRVLTGSENCALCVVASTQRYLVGTLKPIHPGCDCSSCARTADSDPGQVLNRRVLDSLHDDIEAELKTRDPEARDLGLGKTGSDGAPISDFTDLIIVNDHSELGPTLGWRADKFTGPPQTPRSKPTGFDAMTVSQIQTQIRILEGLRDTDYKTTQLARLRARLAEL